MRHDMDHRRLLFSCLIAAGLLLSTGSLKTVLAQTAPPLGTAQNFAVLGASTVTNVDSAGTVLTGNLGVWPGSAITGFPPGVVIGTIHIGQKPRSANSSKPYGENGTQIY